MPNLKLDLTSLIMEYWLGTKCAWQTNLPRDLTTDTQLSHVNETEWKY